MRITFSGTFECKEDKWTYEFFQPHMALTVNADGAVLLCCPEVVLEIEDETDRLEWLWKDRAKIQRTGDAVTVHVKRREKWKLAASFRKERNEI